MSSNLLNIAKKACRHFHAGKRFRDTTGPYYEHPEAVADLVSTVPQKILALLHDVIEETVEQKYKEYLLESDDPQRREFEEFAIELAFNDLRKFFQSNGASASQLESLEETYIPMLNALTRRTSDTYEEYRGDLIAFVQSNRLKYMDAIVVKRADSKHNRLQNRNLPTRREGQNIKTAKRLKRYDNNERILSVEFPESTPYLRPDSQHRSKQYMYAHRPYDKRRSKGERLTDGYGEFRLRPGD